MKPQNVLGVHAALFDVNITFIFSYQAISLPVFENDSTVYILVNATIKIYYKILQPGSKGVREAIVNGIGQISFGNWILKNNLLQANLCINMLVLSRLYLYSLDHFIFTVHKATKSALLIEVKWGCGKFGSHQDSKAVCVSSWTGTKPNLDPPLRPFALRPSSTGSRVPKNFGCSNY